MCPLLKIMPFTLILLIALGNSAIAEQLDIIYTDRDNENEAQVYTPYLIDNQSYLKEYRERRSRARAVPGPIFIIERSARAHSSHRHRGIEYYDGSTMLRYYDGYRVNRTHHFHTVTPRRRPPQSTNHRRPYAHGENRR